MASFGVMIKRRIVPSRCQPLLQSGNLDLEAIADGLEDLAGNKASDLVLEIDEDRRSAVVLIQRASKTSPLRLQLLALRGDDDRPIQFRPGSPLSSVGVEAGASTGDVTQVSIWPDGVTAQDWYGDVPRLTRLAEFLRIRFEMRYHFKPIYSSSLLDSLADLHGQIRGVRISINGDHKATPDPGVFGSLIPEWFGSKAPSVSVNLGMGKYGPRNQYLDDDVEQAVLSVAERGEEILDNLIVVGRSISTGKMRTINLLRERLQKEVQIERSTTDTSRPDEEAAFTIIESVVEGWRDSDALGVTGNQDLSG